MSVDTRAHITSDTLQQRAVLRRTTLYAKGADDGVYRLRRAVALRNHQGEEMRLTVEDLGAALRVLGVSWQNLGYKPRR